MTTPHLTWPPELRDVDVPTLADWLREPDSAPEAVRELLRHDFELQRAAYEVIRRHAPPVMRRRGGTYL